MIHNLFGRKNKTAAQMESGREQEYAGMQEAEMIWEDGNSCSKDDAKEVDPQQIARLQKMGENLHHVLRMAAMDMLREEDGGFVMEVGNHVLHMPDAATLFEAYLVLEEMYGGDFSELDQVLSEPWTKKAIEMVLAPEAHIGVWRALRMKIIAEALPMLKKHGSAQQDERDSKFFTLLCIHICDKVIDTLRRSDERTDAT